MVEGGMKCIKYLLFFFNLIFFLAGLGLIIAGAVVQVKFKEYLVLFGGTTLSAAAIVLIIIGVVVFIIGFFGCCGAYKENYCMTMTFAFLLLIIFIVEIAVGIAAFAMRSNLETAVKNGLHDTMKNYTDGADIKKAWDLAQHELKCCGTYNSTGWIKVGLEVPKSCCKEGKDCDTKDQTKIFSSGCVDKFEEWVKHNVGIIGGVGIALAFVQIVGIILACCLARSIKKEYEVV